MRFVPVLAFVLFGCSKKDSSEEVETTVSEKPEQTGSSTIVIRQAVRPTSDDSQHSSETLSHQHDATIRSRGDSHQSAKSQPPDDRSRSLEGGDRSSSVQTSLQDTHMSEEREQSQLRVEQQNRIRGSTGTQDHRGERDDRSGRPEAGERGSSVRKFLELSRSLKEEVKKIFPQVEANKSDSCLVSPIKLVGGQEIEFDQTAVLASGSGSKLFRSTNPNNKFVVKYIEGKKNDKAGQYKVKKVTLTSLADEYALLKVYQGHNHIVPDLYEIDPTSMKESCYIRLMVTGFAGEHQMKSIAKVTDLSKRLGIIRDVAARGLEILKEFHDLGFIHGDVHYKNFVFDGDVQDAGKSLQMLDFGRSEPYVNPADGSHCRKEEKSYGMNWSAWHLSPWELGGERKTRRDDIFRWAESLLRSGNYDGQYDKDDKTLSAQTGTSTDTERLAYRQGVKELKEKRKFDQTTPKILIDFYQYSLTIGYSDRPDYEQWIQKFRSSND